MYKNFKHDAAKGFDNLVISLSVVYNYKNYI